MVIQKRLTGHLIGMTGQMITFINTYHNKFSQNVLSCKKKYCFIVFLVFTAAEAIDPPPLIVGVA